jgi:hypothetical protein
MAAVSAIDDAKRFLQLHPWSTTAIDNPVKLLEAVVDEINADYTLKDDVLTPDDIGTLKEPAEKLLAFIKGLRDDCKISEAEYQVALDLIK